MKQNHFLKSLSGDEKETIKDKAKKFRRLKKSLSSPKNLKDSDLLPREIVFFFFTNFSRDEVEEKIETLGREKKLFPDGKKNK